MGISSPKIGLDGVTHLPSLTWNWRVWYLFLIYLLTCVAVCQHISPMSSTAGGSHSGAAVRWSKFSVAKEDPSVDVPPLASCATTGECSELLTTVTRQYNITDQDTAWVPVDQLDWCEVVTSRCIRLETPLSPSCQCQCVNVNQLFLVWLK